MQPLTITMASRRYDGVLPIVCHEATIPNVNI
jgi:hypothetical protein